ncbi:MAG: endonuclease [Paludibacter sp.]|nr:endonuclease [Paludibacter sp.]
MNKNTKNKLAVVLVLFITTLNIVSQPTTGYYHDLDGKNTSSLKTALYTCISTHTALSYGDLWDAFRETDRRADGKVWDIYSSATNYTFGTNQCGNYSGEGSCYNREHSFPKSWFDDASPMYTDLFHLYPSDGYVNGRRSNYPFGEVGSITYQSSGGYCKLGNASSTLGYNGTVFEPADEYKGDLARTYFYMVTSYENVVAGWYSNSEARPTLNGTTYPAFNQWVITMLLNWSRQDPVSQKEINRNNAVEQWQNNRNPFIDFAGIEEYIWGNKKSELFSMSSTSTYFTTNDNLKIYSTEGNIFVENCADNTIIYLYDYTGTLLKTETANSNLIKIPIQPHRFIIVKAENKVMKILTQ